MATLVWPEAVLLALSRRLLDAERSSVTVSLAMTIEFRGIVTTEPDAVAVDCCNGTEARLMVNPLQLPVPHDNVPLTPDILTVTVVPEALTDAEETVSDADA